MLDLIVSLVTGNVGVNLRRFARVAAFAGLTAAFLLIALIAASTAGYLALEAALGPVRATLVVAGVAALLAGLASIPLWAGSKPAPKPAAASLVELALVVGLGMLAERKGRKDA